MKAPSIADRRNALMGQLANLKASIVDADRTIEQAQAAKREANERIMSCIGALETLDMVSQQFNVTEKVSQ